MTSEAMKSDAPLTVADELREVGKSHRLLSSFFERYAALLRSADVQMKEKGFVAMGKNPRCYTSCTTWVSLGADASAWLPEYAIYGWKKGDSSNARAAISLWLKDQDSPQLLLIVSRAGGEEWEDLKILQDLTWFDPQPKQGMGEWTSSRPSGKSSKAQYEVDVLRLSLDLVSSQEQLREAVILPLVARFEQVVGGPAR